MVSYACVETLKVLKVEANEKICAICSREGVLRRYSSGSP